MFSTLEYSCVLASVAWPCSGPSIRGRQMPRFAEKKRRRQEAPVVQIEVEVLSRVLLAIYDLTSNRDWWGYVRQNQFDAGSPEPHARVHMMGKQSMVIIFVASAVSRMRSHISRSPLCILASETAHTEKLEEMTESMWWSSRSDTLDSVPSSFCHPETS